MAERAAKHIIVGTAGHVDHGKTALIRALTGIETDRHPEERLRGLSIDLGFAHMTLPSGLVAGIVDVPGHERFVHNMLAGAAEMDMVLLVVAADEGVMPQTEEHLEILNLLHARRGIVVITKKDLVEDEEWLELVKEDVRERVKGTFLEGAPVVAVSSVTGEGLEELIQTMDEVAQQVPPKDTDRPFRLPVDDTFVKAGFGTIVRGAVFSGRVKVGEEVEVVPAGIVTRVRSLHTYGNPVNEAIAGQRAAMNLGGVERKAVGRGDVIVHPETLLATGRMDVQLRLLPSVPRPLKDGSPIRFHLGTAERTGRLFFFGKEELSPGEEAFGEIRLDKPVACAWGDLFVIRSYSPIRTLGGGKVVEPHPPFQRRRKAPETLRSVREKGKGQRFFLQGVLSENPSGISVKALMQRLFLTPKEIQTLIEALVGEGVVFPADAETLLPMTTVRGLREKLLHHLQSFHEAHPLRRGMAKESLRASLNPDLSPSTFEALLRQFAEEGLITLEREIVRLRGHQVVLDERIATWAKEMEREVKGAGFTPPKAEELLAKFPDRDKAKDLLALLLEEGKLIRIGEFIFHPETIERAKEVAQQLWAQHGSFKPSQFREAIGTTRRYAIPLLEFLDHIGVTIRRGDERVLREGKK